MPQVLRTEPDSTSKPQPVQCLHLLPHFQVHVQRVSTELARCIRDEISDGQHQKEWFGNKFVVREKDTEQMLEANVDQFLLAVIGQ